MSKTLFDIICERRGWTPEFLARINDPSHAELRDLDVMVEHLKRIHDSQELIVVLPDFDMDGITSGTLGFAGLCELGFNTALYRPDAQRGHGFSPWDVEQICDAFPDVKAIITCDTGIDSYAGVDAGVRKGITMLVTDHHKEIPRGGTSSYLPAHAVVDPSRIDDPYALKGICGAHVLYQVLAAYTRAHAPHQLEDVSLLRLFAGIGTVSDVMPVLFENRRMVTDSVAIAKLLHVQPEVSPDGERLMPDVNESTLMSLLRARPHHPVFLAAFDGMARVIAHFAVIGKLRSVDDLDEGFYGWYLAPAFNAIRRMQGSMDDAFGAFFAQDKDDRIELVIEMNEQRKALVESYMQQVDLDDQPWAPYLYTTKAPGGMLGLMANKLMQRSGVPTLVVHDHEVDGKEVSGSGRAPTWYDFNSALNANGFWAAGHEQAFGVRLRDRSAFDEVYAFLDQAVPQAVQLLKADGTDVTARPVELRLGTTPDCDAGYDDVDELLELARRIELMKPFGHQFPAPEIELVADLAECTIELIGSEQQHLRISLPSGVRCLHWNAADMYMDLTEAAASPVEAERIVRMVAHAEVNTFMGHVSPNFKVIDVLGVGAG